MNSLVYFSGDMLINFLTDIIGVCWFSKDTSLLCWSNFSVCVWMLGIFGVFVLLGFLCVFWSISDEFAVAFFGVYVGQFAMDIMSWSAFER